VAHSAGRKGLIVVTSAGEANGGGRDAVLAFNAEGALVGPFSEDPRIEDPRGVSLDPSGTLIFLNSADRLLAVDRSGRVVRDTGPIGNLDPGGSVFGQDGRYYVTTRRRRTILGISASLDGHAEPLLAEEIVPFPRGFGFGPEGSLYLASGIGPSGEGDNTIIVFDADAPAQPRPLVTDPELSPLDLTVAPNGHILVASEYPFRARNAVVTVREYDPATGDLVRIFVPDRSVNFRRPRGLRFGPEGRLYCVGEAHVVAFDFSTGDFLGPVIQLPGLHGQALVVLDSVADPPPRGGLLA
jgi:DNA-binding beta-propeller fold protein YncE